MPPKPSKSPRHRKLPSRKPTKAPKPTKLAPSRSKPSKPSKAPSRSKPSKPSKAPSRSKPSKPSKAPSTPKAPSRSKPSKPSKSGKGKPPAGKPSGKHKSPYKDGLPDNLKAAAFTISKRYNITQAEALKRLRRWFKTREAQKARNIPNDQLDPFPYDELYL